MSRPRGPPSVSAVVFALSVGLVSVRPVVIVLFGMPGDDSTKSELYAPLESAPRVGSGCSVTTAGVVPPSGAASIHGAELVAVHAEGTLLSSAKLSVWAAIGAPLTALKVGTPELRTN